MRHIAPIFVAILWCASAASAWSADISTFVRALHEATQTYVGLVQWVNRTYEDSNTAVLRGHGSILKEHPDLAEGFKLMALGAGSTAGEHVGPYVRQPLYADAANRWVNWSREMDDRVQQHVINWDKAVRQPLPRSDDTKRRILANRLTGVLLLNDLEGARFAAIAEVIPREQPLGLSYVALARHHEAISAFLQTMVEGALATDSLRKHERRIAPALDSVLRSAAALESRAEELIAQGERAASRSSDKTTHRLAIESLEGYRAVAAIDRRIADIVEDLSNSTQFSEPEDLARVIDSDDWSRVGELLRERNHAIAEAVRLVREATTHRR